MMLCDISVVFNSFADAFGLMNLNSVGRRSAQLAIRAYGSAPWLLTHSGQAAEVKQKPSNGPASSKTSMIGAPCSPFRLAIVGEIAAPVIGSFRSLAETLLPSLGTANHRSTPFA
jgi:hypothetical protein